MSLCEGCHAGCCRSFAVPVTGADILRIHSRLGLGFWDVACRWADPLGKIALKHAPQFHFDDEPQTPFVICLLHAPSRNFEGTQKCQFLEETPPTPESTRGVAHCGIYEHRPSACRAFPAKLNSTGELAIIYDVPAAGRSGGDPAYDLCRRQWEPDDLDPVQMLQDLVVARYEMSFFHSLAAIWNQNPGPWKRFPEFLELVYKCRIRSRDEAARDEEALEEAESHVEPVYPRIAA